MRFLSPLLFLLFLPVAANSAQKPMDVFVSIAPQQFLVDQIGGPLVKSHLLVDKGQDPHSFEPTPRRLVELGRARLYFTVGLDFERQLTARLGKSYTGLRFVAMDKGIDKLPMEEHEEKGEPPHPGEKDPHIWLSPVLLLKMAENTENALAKEDKELLPYKGKTFYVFHPAFGYFAAAFGLIQRAVEAGGHSPSPRQLAAFIERARKHKIRIIFVQPQFDPKGAEAIAKAIDGTVVSLNPLAYDVLGNFSRIAEQLDRSFQ
ncbi:MAG: zinc ABC transporter substrate-binding protein [Deltaproteobacteria bacterium]